MINVLTVPAALCSVLDNLVRVLQGYQQSSRNLLGLCHIALLMIKLPDADSYSDHWRQVLSRFGTSFENHRTSWRVEDLELAEKCMHMVHALECHNAVFVPPRFTLPSVLNTREPEGVGYFPLGDEPWYQLWLRHFDPRKSLFPDNFIQALSNIARKETRWYRVRRLREMGYHMPPL